MRFKKLNLNHLLIFCFSLSFIFGFNIKQSFALSLESSDFLQAELLAANESVLALIKAVGIGGDYRPLQSATGPSGLLGLDIGATVYLSQVPPEFIKTLKDAGYSPPEFNSIPVPHLRVSKSITDFLSIDAAYLKYKTFNLRAVAIQFFTSNNEGANFSLRMSYSKNSLGIINTTTLTPSIMIGKNLTFFEPYFGIGYQIANGEVDVSFEKSNYLVHVRSKGNVQSLIAYGGLVINVLLLQIAFEGSHSQTGVNGLGAKVGITF